jgi:hypothetical protein
MEAPLLSKSGEDSRHAVLGKPPRRPMRAELALVAGAICLLLAPPTTAHVAPSERENNRYILVAPLGDRIRLAYTVYMGQVPGRQARARMDANRDGRLDEGEARRYGDQVAAQTAPRLSVEVDGRPVAVEWDEIDVGLGQPVTAAGAFAVDLIAWICLEQPRERLTHRLHLRDSFHLPDPGESELRAEESPGVRILRSHLGRGRDTLRLDHRWTGGPGPMETSGYDLEFVVDPALALYGGEACGAPPGDEDSRPWILLVPAALAICTGAWLLMRRRRRRS